MGSYLSSKGLCKENYNQIINFYINSIDEQELAAFESPDESFQQKEIWLGSCLKIISLTLLMAAAAIFPRPSLAMQKRVSLNLQANQALVVSRKEPNKRPTVAINAKTRIVSGKLLSSKSQPTILHGTTTEN